jgi:hypothetical protein
VIVLPEQRSEEENMIPSKKFTVALFSLGAFLIYGCSGVKLPPGGTGGTGGTGGQGASSTISGNIIGLAGSGLVLENNGTDDITVKGTGNMPFTFKTPVSTYKVTVKTQPTNPVQNCSVANGAGTATANVTNVQVTCGLVYSVGGSLSGLATSSSITLQDNAGDNLALTTNGTFTFATPLSAGSNYAVTILTQPTTPPVVCTVLNGTGTANVNITNVQIICPQPGYTVGGQLVGLVPGPGDTVELQNNAGDNLFITGDNQTFTFPTDVTSGGIYNVSVFLEPTSQPQPCNIFNPSGVATANVTNILVDCQHNDWAWIFGPTSVNQYATVHSVTPLLFPNPNNPGGRDFGVTWTDNAGRKWLFGGFGFPLNDTLNPPPAFLNDLWVWDTLDGFNQGWIPANQQVVSCISVTCINTIPLEEENVRTVYGTLGVAGGIPGSRWGGASWTDGSGNLWMFGGQGFDSTGIAPGLLNDLWEFTPSGLDPTGLTYNGQWTWQGGPTTFNKPGVYGTLGTPSATNIPGGRWAAATFVDASGTLWLFGGQGYDSANNISLLSDLWKYSGGQWTWVGGSNVGNLNGVYGTQGTAAPANIPGGRQNAVLWVDPSGTVWLFGGFGLDSIATVTSINGKNPTLNDLWKFSGGQWTWVSGSTTANDLGMYGTQLTSSATTVPGSRWGPVGWTDAKGNLWLFGGWGYGSDATHGQGFLNDTWEYNVTSGQWTWWKGSSDVNQGGQYLQHVSFVGNVPGARRGTSLWQPDSLDYIWIFGGQGYDATPAVGNGYLADLWTYLPYP